MSIKINKNDKEYPLGVIPQSLYDDVEDLKDEINEIKDKSIVTLTSTDNLDNCTNPNVIYQVNSGDTPSNAPTGFNIYSVIVTKSGWGFNQIAILYNGTKIACRVKQFNSWSSWSIYSGT